MKIVLTVLLILILIGTAIISIFGCNAGITPPEDVYEEELQ